MTENTAWIVVDLAVAVFLLIFGWYALFRTSRLQRRYVESAEQGYAKSLYPQWMLSHMVGKTNAAKIRIGGVVAMTMGCAIIFFQVF